MSALLPNPRSRAKLRRHLPAERFRSSDGFVAGAGKRVLGIYRSADTVPYARQPIISVDANVQAQSADLPLANEPGRESASRPDLNSRKQSEQRLEQRFLLCFL